MEVGFNYPWPRNQAYTIGPNTNERDKPHPWRASPSDLDRNLRTLRDAGVSVVRMWLLAHGHNYDGTVTRRYRPPLGGYGAAKGYVPPPQYDWVFEPPARVHSLFVDDFEALFEKLKPTGMKLIPSLLDYSFFDEPENPDPARYPEGVPTATALDYIRGRRSIVENPAYRARFVDGTLRPLLEVAARHRDRVYAFEIVNEPWWAVASVTKVPGLGGVTFGRQVAKDRFAEFLTACLKVVKEYGLESTIGHRYYRDITEIFPDVKPTRPQFHFYAGRGVLALRDTLPPAYGIGVKPFVGEFGAITSGELDVLRRHHEYQSDNLRGQIDRMAITANPWSMLKGRDDSPSSILLERLRWLKVVGYDLGVIWPNVIQKDETVDALKLDALRLDQIREFTKNG